MNKLLVVTMETDGINIESSPNMDIDVLPSLMATGGQKFQNSIYNKQQHTSQSDIQSIFMQLTHIRVMQAIQ